MKELFVCIYCLFSIPCFGQIAIKKHGRIKEKIIYECSDTLLHSCVEIGRTYFNSTGLETLGISVDRDGFITGKTVYEYDSLGNMVSYSNFDENGIMSKFHTIKGTAVTGIERINPYSYCYDPKISRCERDKYGNLILSIRYANPTSRMPLNITKIEYVYYEP